MSSILKTKKFYERAYSFGSQRRKFGYGWPVDMIESIEKHFIQYVCNNIACKNKNALDIGCGDGRHSLYLAKLGFDITGIDISQNALYLVKDKFNKSHLKGDFFLKDFFEFNTNKKFDLIIDYSVSTHFHPKILEKYFSKIKKLLKSGGFFIWVGFSDSDPHCPKRKYFVKNGQYFIFLDNNDLKKYLHGLDIIKIKETKLELEKKSIVIKEKKFYKMKHVLFHKNKKLSL